MPDTIVREVQSSRDLKHFIRFPWKIYGDDPYWVPPLIQSQEERLDRSKNPYWLQNDQKLWLAWKGEQVVGTIGAFRPTTNPSNGAGYFGFFEAINDQNVAAALIKAAATWLKGCGANWMRGPYNPSTSDECGLLVEGFNSRPALLEAHTAPYYPDLVESQGFYAQNEMYARLYKISPEYKRVEQVLPQRLLKVAQMAAERSDLCVRPVRVAQWEQELRIAWQIYNDSLEGLPEYVPIPWEEFRQMAGAFRQIIIPEMALLADVNGKPAGFVLVLPDFNEALQAANGRLFPFGIFRLWWRSQRISRATLKILVIRPEFQGRGVEAVLLNKVGQAILDRGFKEVDMSLTGAENEKSNRFQAHLGFQLYRRHKIYQKDLA